MTAIEHPTEPRPVKLTVTDYRLLDEAGAFNGYPKTELIDGTILVMNAAYSRHARAQSFLFRALDLAARALEPPLDLLIEPSVLLDDLNLPQPDLALFREVPEDGPLPLAGMALVVEIADSSRDFDLGRKAALYAAAGVPEYWVADTITRRLHRMWGPAAEGYRGRDEAPFGGTVAAATLPALAVETAGL